MGFCAFRAPHGNDKMIRTSEGDLMKRTLTTVFLLAAVFRAVADCPDNPCPPGITSILDCPDEGCRQTAFDPNHPYDSELNKRKNVRSDDQQPVLRSVHWIKVSKIQRISLSAEVATN
jgi:hypothetical protein